MSAILAIHAELQASRELIAACYRLFADYERAANGGTTWNSWQRRKWELMERIQALKRVEDREQQ